MDGSVIRQGPAHTLPCYLPGNGSPSEWLDDAFRLRDLNIVTTGDLPARLDWSIMGWTILLLAFINLCGEEEKKKKKITGLKGELQIERTTFRYITVISPLVMGAELDIET